MSATTETKRPGGTVRGGKLKAPKFPPWFEKAIARFPAHADAYYYRGISFLATGKQAEAKADLLKFVGMAKPDAVTRDVEAVLSQIWKQVPDMKGKS